MRLFVAVNFNEKFKIRLLEIIGQLQKHTDSGNFTLMQNLHITLQFIGETENVNKAKEALSSIEFDTLRLSFDRLSCFKRQGGDICWLGVSEDGQLRKLAGRVGQELSKRGFRLEDRTFQVHLTLGREVVFKHGFKPEEFILPDDLKCFVDRISLEKSERLKGILTYSEVYSKSSNNA